MADNFDQQRQELESFVFKTLSTYRLHLIPDELVRVSCLLLVKMLSPYLPFDLIKVIALGSVWAWSFDEIVDDPKILLSEKMDLLNRYKEISTSWNLKKVKEITPDVPKTSELIIDALNRLISDFNITDIDREFLFKQFNLCVQGAEFETINAGKVVDLEQSLFARAYSYATPFYGAMIFVGFFHFNNTKEVSKIEEFLELFGRITRIRNDLSTFEKEKDGKEINIVSVLMQSGRTELEALALAQKYYDKADSDYKKQALTVPPGFSDVITNFKRVHDSAYEIKDIRTLKSESLAHI